MLTIYARSVVRTGSCSAMCLCNSGSEISLTTPWHYFNYYVYRSLSTPVTAAVQRQTCHYEGSLDMPWYILVVSFNSYLLQQAIVITYKSSNKEQKWSLLHTKMVIFDLPLGGRNNNASSLQSPEQTFRPDWKHREASLHSAVRRRVSRGFRGRKLALESLPWAQSQEEGQLIIRG